MIAMMDTWMKIMAVAVTVAAIALAVAATKWLKRR